MCFHFVENKQDLREDFSHSLFQNLIDYGIVKVS